MDREALKTAFLERLQLFCFFHLGSDVESGIEEEPEGLRISLCHHRIEPLEFPVSYARLEGLLEVPQDLEGFLLEHITPRRR